MAGKDKVKSSSIDLTMDSSCIGDVLRIHFPASKKKVLRSKSRLSKTEKLRLAMRRSLRRT